MSAITKPMIHTTSATVNPSAMVNIERCTSIDKVDAPSGPGNSNPRWEIQFQIASDSKSGVPGRVVWNYALEATRNADYVKIITIASGVLV